MTVRIVIVPNPLDTQGRSIEEREGGVTLLEMLPEWATHQDAAAVWIDGKRIPKSDWDSMIPDDGTSVGVQRTVEGIELGTALLYAAVSFATSYVVSLLFPPPEAALAADDESSPTYGFGGIRNSIYEGLPIQVAYGEVQMAGQIIAQAIDTANGSLETVLKLMIAYGHGPFAQIGQYKLLQFASFLTGDALPEGLEINGNSATNYDDILSHLRHGTSDQKVVSGFDEIRQVYEMGQALTSPETVEPAILNVAPGFIADGSSEYDGTNDDYWDTYGVAYDLAAEPVDGFVIRLRFPRGLYSQADTGGLDITHFGFQVRYIAINSVGDPVTIGGHANDGYVRLAPYGPLAWRRRSAGEYQISGQFLNPATYDPLQPGTALRCPGAIADTAAAVALPAQTLASGDLIDNLAASCWIRVDAGVFGVSGTPRPVPILGSITNNRGWALYLQRQSYGAGGEAFVLHFAYAGSQGETRYRVKGPNGDFTRPPIGSFLPSDEGRWIHVGVHFARGSTLRLYVDGQELYPQIASPSFSPPNWHYGALTVGHFPVWSSFDDLFRLKGRVDQVVVWTEPVTPAYLRREWSNGTGTTDHSGNPVAIYEFEAASATNAAVEPWWDTMSLTGAVTSGVVVGGVLQVGNGEELPGRYRLEIVRTNETSTSPRVANEVEVLDIQSIRSAGIAYSGIALQALEIRASEQLNGNLPKITQTLKARLCPVWDRLDELEPTAITQYTANPAWIICDLATHPTIGMGSRYRLADLDLPSFAEFADHCDEIVEDGRRTLYLDSTEGCTAFFNATIEDEVGPRGVIVFGIPKSAIGSLPVTWKVGRFLKLKAWPSVSSGLGSEVNSTRIEGYEIKEILETSSVFRITVWWDRLDEPNPWTSGTTELGTFLGSSWTGQIFGARRRYEFNGVFDKLGSDADIWNAMLKVAAVARAVPIREGRRLRMKWEAPRLEVGLITSASIIEGSFQLSYTSPKDHPNTMDVSILDASSGYERSTVRVFGDAVQDSLNAAQIRSESNDLFGVTDKGQAANHAKFLLNTYELLRRQASFRVGPDGLQYEPGDVVIIAPDLLERGTSGRVPSDSLVVGLNKLIQDGEDLTTASWTRSNATVQTNTLADPYGDVTKGRLTDSSQQLWGEVSQDFSRSNGEGFAEGTWSVSLFMRNVDSPVSRVEIRTGDGWVAGLIDWVAGTYTFDKRPDSMVGGIRRQRVDDYWYFVTIWIYWDPSNHSIPPKFLISPAFNPTGQANASGTIEVSKVASQRGKYGALFNSRRGIVLDQPYTIDHAETVQVRVHSLLDTVERSTVDFTMMPEREYQAGATLFLVTDLGQPALRSNPYTLFTAGQLLRMQITSTTLGENLERTVEAMEYNALAFNDHVELEDPLEDSTSGLRVGGGSFDDDLDAEARESRLPERLANLEIGDEVVATPSGPRNSLRLTWELPANSDPSDEVRVHARPLGAQGGWDLLGKFDARQGGAEFTVPEELGETVFEVSAQLVSRAGLAKSIDGSARAAHRFSGIGPVPPSPTGVRAVLVGTRLQVTWEEAKKGLGLVGRRGGWVLGDRAFGIRPGDPSTGLSEQWAIDPFSEGVGTLHVATIDQAGRPSVPVEVTVEGSPAAIPGETEAAVPPTRWEASVGGGWYSGPPFDSEGPRVFGGLSEQEDGSLGFGGSELLTGTYRTDGDGALSVTARSGRVPRHIFPQAVVEASQVHPTQQDWHTDDPRFERWTAEGPIYLAAGEAECALVIEMSVLEDDSPGSSWGDWLPYAPGEVFAVDVRFRLRATRPSEEFDIRITRFHTALLAVAEASEVQAGSSFTHVQSTPASVWTINHNLGRLAPVIVLDSDGYELTCQKQIGENQTIVSHRSDQTGKAVVG